MATQINFKFLDPQEKRRFTRACAKEKLKSSECLRALTTAFAAGKISPKMIRLLRDSEPEHRGRKPKSSSSSRPLRRHTQKSRRAKRAAA